MRFPFSFNGFVTAIQNITPSCVGETGNVVRDIAMEDASWFNLIPDLNHGQTLANPTYGGDIKMNDSYAFIETKDEIPDHVEKDMVMEDNSISESRGGLSMLSLEDDSGDETEVGMEDEPSSDMREALSAFIMGDPNQVPNLTLEDITMGNSGSEPGVSYEALRDPLDAALAPKRRRLYFYKLTPTRRRRPVLPRRQLPAYIPMYVPGHPS